MGVATRAVLADPHPPTPPRKGQGSHGREHAMGSNAAEPFDETGQE